MKQEKMILVVSCLVVLVVLSGCTTYTTEVENVPPSRATRYAPIDTTTRLGSTGIESQDIISMTDKMVRDLLSTPIIMNRTEPAVLILDEKYFENDSSQRINKKLITDRMRFKLLRAANGKIKFPARHVVKMFKDEQKLRKTKEVRGKVVKTRQKANYRLTGNFKNFTDSIGGGAKSNYVQIIFELVDLDTNEIVWTNMYEFKKTSRESSFYR
ncbi:MAG: penicillin-binding protein activator LpoB [Verrucomicrobiota bacterium]|nr:penicillin-binding protein activator LpoB [Verrucomicrobiota bacterium]